MPGCGSSPECPMVANYVEKHDEFQDIVDN